MLIEFSVGNFKSFKEKATLSMVAAKITSEDKAVDANSVVPIDERLSLLKSTAIYGANASGKSNIVSAMKFMRDYVLGSSKETQATEKIEVECFRLSEETRGKPSFFEAIFLIGDTTYRYGFEVDTERVVSEWLYYAPKGRERTLFERTEAGIHLQTAFKEGKGLEEKTRKNALFLSVVAQFNGPIAGAVLEWFANLALISGLQDRIYREMTIRALEEKGHKDAIVRLVKALDLGIDDIMVDEIIADPQPYLDPSRSLPIPPFQVLYSIKSNFPFTANITTVTKRVGTIHTVYDPEGRPSAIDTFDMDSHESEGTKKLFALAGPLLDVLQNGRVLFIDELDARLHPLITSAIIRLFNSQVTNPHRAQLVFATHDTNLLNRDLLRRDQIWFTEKDSRGATHLYSLAEFKVRNDAAFESGYIRGKYGAIPFLGDFRNLFGDDDA